MEEIRSTPLSVGTLEEMIDDNHAIVSTAHGPEYYVTVMSFVNQVRPYLAPMLPPSSPLSNPLSAPHRQPGADGAHEHLTQTPVDPLTAPSRPYNRTSSSLGARSYCTTRCAVEF